MVVGSIVVATVVGSTVVATASPVVVGSIVAAKVIARSGAAEDTLFFKVENHKTHKFKTLIFWIALTVIKQHRMHYRYS